MSHQIEMNVDTQLSHLYNVLRNPSYYSLEINYLSKLTNISPLILRMLSHPSSLYAIRFHQLTHDTINVFTYNNVEYVGLETRRLDYERDKAAGTNWVEHAIARGEYN